MSAPLVLRDDYNAAQLRALSKQAKDSNQTRCLLALAEIYDGRRRRAAARIGGVGLQTVRDWMLRFNADGPDGLIDGKAPGQQPKLSTAQLQELARVIEEGPIPAAHGVVRWRLVWCAGAWSTWRSGSGTSSRSPSARRR